MSIKINKETYQRLIDEDIEWLKNHTVDSLERRHIIEILNNSIEYYYPDNKHRGKLLNGKLPDGTFAGNWNWSDTKCINCSLFDGYDVCLHKNNYGTIITDKLNKCLKNNFFIEKT